MPAYRPQLPAARVLTSGIPFQTLGFRAPEVLFGDQGFGVAAEAFSLGAVLADLGGSTALFDIPGKAWSQWDYTIALFGALGTPTLPELVRLPLFPASPPRYGWHDVVCIGGCEP